MLPLKDGERVMAVIPTRDFSEGKYLVFATRRGWSRRPSSSLRHDDQGNGLIAINIRKGDELVQVRQTSGKDDIIMVSKSGQASRFDEEQARPMGRGTAGVKGMNVSQKGNEVIALEVARDEDELFMVTENGYGKRTPMTEYPVKGRGTKGVLTAKLTTKKGGLAGAMIVREHQELIFISQNGMVQRTGVKGISQMGRATQGVRVMNMKVRDRVSAVALVVESTEAVPTNGAGPTRTARSRPSFPLGRGRGRRRRRRRRCGESKAQAGQGPPRRPRRRRNRRRRRSRLQRSRRRRRSPRPRSRSASAS